jgi:hypothetical protein
MCRGFFLSRERGLLLLFGCVCVLFVCALRTRAHTHSLLARLCSEGYSLSACARVCVCVCVCAHALCAHHAHTHSLLARLCREGFNFVCCVLCACEHTHSSTTSYFFKFCFALGFDLLSSMHTCAAHTHTRTLPDGDDTPSAAAAHTRTHTHTHTHTPAVEKTFEKNSAAAAALCACTRRIYDYDFLDACLPHRCRRTHPHTHRTQRASVLKIPTQTKDKKTHRQSSPQASAHKNIGSTLLLLLLLLRAHGQKAGKAPPPPPPFLDFLSLAHAPRMCACAPFLFARP